MRRASLLLVVVLLVAFTTPVVLSQSTTIIVPDDFSTIQQAVDAANPGDTVFVRAGTYNEVVTVDTDNLELTGENKLTTIIDRTGGNNQAAINIKADRVTVSGFTIQNSYDGIRLDESSFSTVSGNVISVCSMRGIILVSSSFVTVSGNTLTDNYDGIELYRSSFVSVFGNIITNSRLSIGSSNSFNNTFSENNIIVSQIGIYIWDCSYTTASGNTITNTTRHSISAVISDYCEFSGNVITNSAMRGISIGNCSNCFASENNIKFTANQGIHSYYSSDITVSENTLTSNFVGFGFYTCSGSTAFGNTISQCRTGITVVNASNNKFYHNSLIANQYSVVVQNCINFWDDGFSSGGNYWSDYSGVDVNGDGIGDTPYIIDVSNKDNYPLMAPFNGTTVGDGTWIVDDDGPADFVTIQEAIDHAENGDIIIVKAGTYYESVVVDKRLSLTGIGYPVVDSNESRSTVMITADDVILEGFAVTNCGFSGEPFGGGIELSNVENCTIKNNIAYQNKRNGISLTNSNYNTIENNICTDNLESGIRLWSEQPLTSSYNLILNNTCNGNKRGIKTWSYVYSTTTSNYNNITANTCYLNDYSGIELGKGRNYVVSENLLTGNEVGLLLDGLDEGTRQIVATNNQIIDNSVGIKLYGSELTEITVFENLVENNTVGVICESHGLFYHNDFVNNENQVQTSVISIWDDGYPSGGNYWSDYNGTDTDGDGIGDVPYIIDENNQDNYPLVPVSNGSVHNLDTGLDYTSIQAAISAPETLSGHTILVDSGTYYENVVVNKAISLIGEDRANTIVDGGGVSSPVVFVNQVTGVTISGFTIQNGERSIFVSNSRNTVVSGNTIKDSHGGIHIDNSENSTISGNIITNSTWSGVQILSSVSSFVSENTVTDNSPTGVHVLFSENAVVSGNTVTNSNYTGISFSSTNNSVASGNLVTQSGSMSIIFSSSYNISVFENVITNGDSLGVVATSSSTSTIVRNTIATMVHHGIYIGGSENIYVNANNITDCSLRGIEVFESTNNVFTENTVSNVTLCVEVNNSSGNLFYHNSFISDFLFLVPVRVINCTNTWDDGYPSGGNYWSNYYGTDADGDGIGDTPYTFGETEQDNYPLMFPYGSNMSGSYTVVVESIPSGVTFTAQNMPCTTPWSETYNETTLVTLVMPESYTYEEKIYNWTRWSDGDTNRTRTVNVDKYTELAAIFTIEFVVPELLLLSPENTTYTTTDVPLEYTTSTPIQVMTYSLDEQENVTFVGNTTLTDLDEGPHSIVIYNEYFPQNFTSSDTVYFTVNTTVPDTTPPTVTLLSPTNTTYTSDDASLNFTVDEQTDWIGYSLDGQANITITGNTTLTGLTEGQHSLLIYANDTSGNTGASNTTYFTVALPISGVTILSPENTTYTPSDVPFGYLVNETATSVVYSLDGQPPVDAENVTVLSGLSDGVHELVVVANFTGSETSESATVWFTVDTVSPEITGVTVLPLTVNGSFEDGAKVNATVTDTTTGVDQVTLNYTIDNQTWTTTEMANLEVDIWNCTLPGFPHATNVTYTIIAKDMAGNTVTTEELYGQPSQYQVLPEFGSWLLVPLLLATAIAGITLRKRLTRRNSKT